jgi:hypothetical protein
MQKNPQYLPFNSLLRGGITPPEDACGAKVGAGRADFNADRSKLLRADDMAAKYTRLAHHFR